MVQFDTTQRCHGLVRFRYGHWLRRNLGNIYVLNHEDNPMDITQARVCTSRVFKRANLQKIYAGERLNLSQYTKEKVKVKTE